MDPSGTPQFDPSRGAAAQGGGPAPHPGPGGPSPYGPRPGYGPPPLPPQPAPRRFLGCFIALLIFLLAGGALLGFTVLLIAAVDTTGSSRSVFERHFAYEKTADNKVVILTIDGLITQDPQGFVKKQIDRALEDKKVKAIVLRVNSPGGTVSGSDYYLHHLRELKDERDIPIVVSMGPAATSGGYYVAMCGDRLFAERTTFTGSIGVILPLYDASQLTEKLGVREDAVVSHPLKSMGSFFKPMSEEEREIWQALIDENFNLFKQVIREGRPFFAENPEKLDAIATGQVYTAQQAVENQLIDEIGFVEDAVEWVIDHAQLNRAKLSVVRYDREKTLSELLIGAEAKKNALPASLAKLTIPQCYFICARGLPIDLGE